MIAVRIPKSVGRGAMALLAVFLVVVLGVTSAGTAAAATDYCWQYDANNNGAKDPGELELCAPEVGGVTTPPVTLPAPIVNGAVTAYNLFQGNVCGGSACIGVSPLTLLGLAYSTTARAIDAVWSNLSSWSPWFPSMPSGGVVCAMATALRTTTGEIVPGQTTVSALQADMSLTAVPPGATSCAFKPQWTIYAIDGAGLLRRCQAATNIIVRPTAPNSTYSLTTGCGASGSASWTVHQVVFQQIPTEIGAFGAVMGNRLEVGSIPAGKIQYRTELRCEASTGGWWVASREDINRIVSSWCDPQNSNGVPTAGATITGTLLTVFARAVVEDGWTKIAEYDLAAAPHPDSASTYPDCYVSGDLVCGFSVQVDGQLCQDGDDVPGCDSWTAVREADPSRVTCLLGAYVVDSIQCNWLERRWACDAVIYSPANMDGVSSTGSCAVASTPSPTTTTTTSTPPPTTTTPPPTTTATTTGDPTGTSTVTGPPGEDGEDGTPGGAGQPSETNPDSDGCYPTGWGVFNPIEWVVKPIKCIFQWAFIPSTEGITAKSDALKAKLETAGPAPVFDAVEANFQMLSGGSGCGGVPVEFNAGGVSQTIPIGQACSGPMATVASYSHALFTVVIAVGGGVSVARAVAAGFGVSFSMGKGGDE